MKSKFLTILLVSLLCSFLLPTSVSAADDTIYYGDSIPAGTLVDHDVVLFGDNVVIDGTVEGNAFILGNQVVINGQVDGSVVFIAQNASVGGEVSGSVYAIALTVDFPSQAVLARDLYAAAVSITSSSGSTISRHLYALGLDAGLNGIIGGDLHTILGPIQLYNGLMRLLGFDELTLELHFETPVQSDTSSGLIPLQHFRMKLLQPLGPFDWGKWGISLLRVWSVLFVFALLCYFLSGKSLEKTRIPIQTSPWKTLGMGLIVLVVSFNLFIVGLILFVVVFALGLGLNFLGLWQLAVLLWVPAFSLLLVSLLGLAFFIAYGSKVILIYFFIKWMLALLFKTSNVYMDVLGLLAGTIIYSLLRSIPYAGWIIDLLVTSVGMGAAWFALRKIPVNQKEETGNVQVIGKKQSKRNN
jgi:cytoskeletal protein CcmA (bactofilin family)